MVPPAVLHSAGRGPCRRNDLQSMPSWRFTCPFYAPAEPSLQMSVCFRARQWDEQHLSWGTSRTNEPHVDVRGNAC